MQKTWAEKKDQPQGCPDGIYSFQLQKLELAESSTGRMMVKREHLCIEGEHEGNVERDQIVIETDFGYRQMSQFIEQMGYQSPEDAGEIEDICAAIMNDAPCYQAKVKKQKDNDFKNVTIISLIDKPSGVGSKKTAPQPSSKVQPGGRATQKVAPSSGGKAPPKDKPAAKEPDPPSDSDDIQVGSLVTYKGDTDNPEFSGKVTEILENGNCNVETEAGELFEVPMADLVNSDFGVGADDASGAPIEEDEEERRAGLLALCQANSIECSDSDTVETLTETLSQYSFKKSELAPEEVSLLESIGGNFEAEAAPKKPMAAKPAPKPAPKPAAKAPAAPAKAKSPPAKAKPQVKRK